MRFVEEACQGAGAYDFITKLPQVRGIYCMMIKIFAFASLTDIRAFTLL